jgi:hypothetical protein
MLDEKQLAGWSRRGSAQQVKELSQMKPYISLNIIGMFVIIFLALTSCIPKSMIDKTLYVSSPTFISTGEVQTTSLPTQTVASIPTGGRSSGTIPTTPDGQLLLWWNGFPSIYGEFNIDDSMFNNVQPASPAVVNPADSVALAFSIHSDQIAYLTYDEKLALHVADIELKNSVTNILEPPEWIVEKIDMGKNIQMRWGPQDKTILIVNDEGGDSSIVFSIDENKIEYLSDGCSTLRSARDGKSLELWCKLKDNSDEYLVLQGSGQSRRETNLPADDSMVVEDTAFSNEGNSVLMVTSDNKIEIATNIGDVVDTTIKLADSIWSLPQSLYWSSDDSLALVYGASILCPQFYNSEKGQRFERPCWHVVNPKTGEIIWFPTEELASSMDSTWDRIDGTNYPAALSPDGTWLAMSFREGGIRYLVLTSIQDLQSKVVGNIETASMFWTP